MGLVCSARLQLPGLTKIGGGEGRVQEGSAHSWGPSPWPV